MSLIYIGVVGPVLVTYLGLFDPPGKKSNRGELVNAESPKLENGNQKLGDLVVWIYTHDLHSF